MIDPTHLHPAGCRDNAYVLLAYCQGLSNSATWCRSHSYSEKDNYRRSWQSPGYHPLCSPTEITLATLKRAQESSKVFSRGLMSRDNDQRSPNI